MVLEDMVWQNIYATSETDISALEDMFFDMDDDELRYRTISDEDEPGLLTDATIPFCTNHAAILFCAESPNEILFGDSLITFLMYSLKISLTVYFLYGYI
jgi:hypothetical protein